MPRLQRLRKEPSNAGQTKVRNSTTQTAVASASFISTNEVVGASIPAQKQFCKQGSHNCEPIGLNPMGQIEGLPLH
jgi:hypothetical protein